jgi:hypothetical protein
MDPAVLCYSPFECNDTNPLQVIEIDLSYQNLSGPLPTSLGQLSSLIFLDLSNNAFSNSIPDFLGQLSNLYWLDLSNNAFNSSIPDSLGQLSNLSHLSLHNNAFSNSIPDSLGQLSNLYWFDLSNNAFNSSIPDSLGQLSNLAHLSLHNNAFSNSIPDSLGQLSNLYKLYLDSNFLTGIVPNFISRYLTDLRLDSNLLSGALPVNFLQDAVNVELLDLSDNLLTGNLPENVPPSSLLLDFSSNAFTGGIPDWTTWGVVRQLDVHGNSLYANQVLTINLSTFTNVNLSGQAFWQDDAADQGSIRLYSSNGLVGTLDTRHAAQNLRCPYPPRDESFVWLRDGCETDLTLLWILLGASGICAVVSAAWALFAPSGNQTTEDKKRVWLQQVLAVSGWVLVVFDISADVTSCSQMLDFVASYPFSREACQFFNKNYVPTSLYLDGRILQDFSEYFYYQQILVEYDVTNLGLSQLEGDNILTSCEVSFRENCNSAPSCVYDSSCIHVYDPSIPGLPVFNKTCCTQDPSYLAFPVFKTCVYVILATILCKEAFKLGVVVWCVFRDEDALLRLLKSDDVDRGRWWVRPVCYSSPALPLLLARRQFLNQVIYQDFSPAEEWVEFFQEGCLENIPQFILGVYYLTSVTSVGVSKTQLLSLFFGGLSLLMQVYKGYMGLRNSKPKLEGKNSPDPRGDVGYFNICISTVLITI